MSIVFDKVKTKMNLIKEYQKNNNFNFSLSLSDATEEQLKNLRKQGRVNSLGRATSACHSPKVWEDRKQLILESGIDLTKFGWLTKVMKVTKLTKRQVYLTIEKFDIPVYKVIRNK